MREIGSWSGWLGGPRQERDDRWMGMAGGGAHEGSLERVGRKEIETGEGR
jgi:hypothetical protein